MNWKNLVIYPLAAFGLTTIGFVVVNKLNSPVASVTTVLPTPTNVSTVTATPTELPKISINFPKNEEWIQYKSKCSGLSGITIFYPNSWKTGTMGEGKISDGYDNTAEGKKQFNSQCLIQFGYPVAPNSPQDPWVPGLYGLATVSSENWLSEMAKPDESAMVIYNENVKGNTWLVSENDNGNFSWSIHFKNRIYTIKFLNGQEAANLNAVSRGYILQTEREFISKLQFK